MTETSATTVHRGFVFLDRDGTINVDRDYLSDPEQLELCPGAAAGLRKMQQLGLRLVVVTNQSAIARGYFDIARLDQIHNRLRQILAAEGVTLDAIYYCPHQEADQCDCRKPRPGMFRQAEHDFGPIIHPCFVIGDKASDITFGRAIHATTFLVRTGYGQQVAAAGQSAADRIVDDLAAAADAIEGLL